MKPKQRTIMNGILAIMLIVVLIIPAVATYTARAVKVQAVITAQPGDFVEIGYINSGDVNTTAWDVALPTYSDVGANESNPDTVIIEDAGNEYGFYNDVTTVNNTNYVVSNFTLFTHSGKIDYQIHALDITAGEVATYDFLRVTTTYDESLLEPPWPVQLVFWDGVDDFYGIDGIRTGNGTYVIVIDYWAHSHLLTISDHEVYLVFDVEFTNPPDPSYTWSVTVNDLTGETWYYDEGIVMALTSMMSIMLLGVTLALNTEMIDIKIDRKPGGES